MRQRRSRVRERLNERADAEQQESERRRSRRPNRGGAARAAIIEDEREALKERNRQAQARWRARLSDEAADNLRARDRRRHDNPEIREQNRRAQSRRRAGLTAREADDVRARNRQQQAARQADNTVQHGDAYWADWPAEYRRYPNDIAAARRLFYAQARQADGSPFSIISNPSLS
jgi:hypothetical protein